MFSGELSDLLHERNSAWARAQRSDKDCDWLAFRQLRNKFTAKVRKTKAEFYLSSTAESLKNSKKFWSTIKPLSNTCKSVSLLVSVFTNSFRVSNKLDIVNALDKHFISSGFLFKPDNFPLVPSVKEETSCEIPAFYFAPFMILEVLTALKNLNSRKMAGPDKLEPLFLKLASDFIAEPLYHIFKLTLSENKIPDVWKSAFVIPLFKGGDSIVLNNYRPISKHSVPAKVLETLVSDQVIEFLTPSSLLSQFQFQSDIRKEHSTATAALKVVNDILEALDNKQCCLSLYIDFSKAFDTVDHSIFSYHL